MFLLISHSKLLLITDLIYLRKWKLQIPRPSVSWLKSGKFNCPVVQSIGVSQTSRSAMAATPETLGNQERLLSQEGTDSDRKVVQQCDM